mgnify:CR=1 FL=1|jgi:hypothetical protein
MNTSTAVAGPQSAPGVILMAVFRPDHALLEQQLMSIRQQDVTQWSCIVGIDGFDAGAEESVRAVIGEDERFSIVNFEVNLGFYRNFERLLALADRTAAWVALADQDDVWDTSKLRVLTDELATRQVSLVACQARIVDARGVVTGHTDRQQVSLPTLLLDNQVTGSLAVLDPSILRVALPFPEPEPNSYHDHWLGVVAAAVDGYAIVDDILQSYVQHGGNVIGEATGSDVRGRMGRLVAGGPSAGLNRLATQRWGWRQRMAREIGRRRPSALADPGVRAIAEGGLSADLVRELVRAGRARHVGWLRLVALGVGAVLPARDARSPH